MKKLTIALLTLALMVLQAVSAAAEDAQYTSEDLLFLDLEKVVSASRRAQPLNEAPSNIVVITDQQIKNMGARTLADVLSTVPGVQTSVTIKGLGEVWFRGVTGGYNDKVLMLVDGIPWRELIYGQFPTDEQLSLNNIKRIEIIRGPGSTMYGTNAFAGVINIITLKGSELAGTKIEARTSAFDTVGASVMTGNKSGDNEYMVFVNYPDTDGYGHAYDRKGKPTKRADPKQQLDVDLHYSFGDFSLGLRHVAYRWMYLMYADYSDRNEDWKDYFLDVTYNKDILDTLSVSARVYYNYFDHKTDNRVYGSGYATLEEVESRVENTEIFGSGIQLSFNPVDWNSLIAGFDMENEKILNAIEVGYYPADSVSPPVTILRAAEPDHTQKTFNYALFAQDEVTLLDRRST